MRNIEVAVLQESHDPGGTMMFLAKLTQRGHNIKTMGDLLELKMSSEHPTVNTLSRVASLPHGTIKRFCPITIAIVGASRRFLAQARTNQVGFNYVSASLQYSDYSGKADFVVPYAITKADHLIGNNNLCNYYISNCTESMEGYKNIAAETDNDTAGYASPQGLRNILIMQGNHEAWMNFIRLRSCNRNTNETQYVTMLIWEALLNTEDGRSLFSVSGPDCIHGMCREGSMSCFKPITMPTPTSLLNANWPLIRKELNND